MKKIKRKNSSSYENSSVRKARKLAEKITRTDDLEYVDLGNKSELFKFQKRNHWYIIKLFDLSLTDRVIKYLQLLSKENLIPKIYEITENYLIMDYIEGEVLNDIIFNKKSKKRTIELLSKIIKELKRWHDKGFAHGDLHEGNILITKDRAIFIDPKVDNFNDYNYLVEQDLDQINNLEWMINHNKFGGGF